VRRNPVDHWCLTLGEHDTGVQKRDDCFRVPAQTPFLVSLGVDLTSERVADERLHIYLPRDNFAEIATQLDAATGHRAGDRPRPAARRLSCATWRTACRSWRRPTCRM
jgi:hypothetical protein